LPEPLEKVAVFPKNDAGQFFSLTASSTLEFTHCTTIRQSLSSNLTSHLFNSRQTRKTLAFSKDLVCCRAAATWEDMYYNLVKPHKSLRLPVRNVPGRKWMSRTPAISHSSRIL